MIKLTPIIDTIKRYGPRGGCGHSYSIIYIVQETEALTTITDSISSIRTH